MYDEDDQGPIQMEESKIGRASMIGVDKSIRSFLDKIEMKPGDSIIDLSQIVIEEDREN